MKISWLYVLFVVACNNMFSMSEKSDRPVSGKTYVRGRAIEKLFAFNRHKLAGRTEKSASNVAMRELLYDQLRLSLAIAERTDFSRDADFFLLNRAEERCSRAECGEKHWCPCEQAEMVRFSAGDQQVFCRKASECGLLPAEMGTDEKLRFCAEPRNRLRLYASCYHQIYPNCECSSKEAQFAFGRARSLFSAKLGFKEFCEDIALQKQVHSAIPHKICFLRECKKERLCDHESKCLEDSAMFCVSRGVPYFVALFEKLNSASRAICGKKSGKIESEKDELLLCAQEINNFLLGLAGGIVDFKNVDEESFEQKVFPQGGATSGKTDQVCVMSLWLKKLIQENWNLFDQIFSFCWLDIPEKTAKEWEDPNSWSDRADPVFIYRQKLAQAQKNYSDHFIYLHEKGSQGEGLLASPFKQTKWRDLCAARYKLPDRVCVHSCEDSCVECAFEKMLREKESEEHQKDQEALLLSICAQGVLPKVLGEEVGKASLCVFAGADR